jgi:predicted nuclease of predicted toxin-antitoxin system
MSNLNFLADECVYNITTLFVRSLGHNILTVQETGLAGTSDENVLRFAIEHERILITIDMDFSNIRRFPPKSHTGIIVLKIRPQTVEKVHKVLAQVLRELDAEQLGKSLVIIDQGKYRVR